MNPLRHALLLFSVFLTACGPEASLPGGFDPLSGEGVETVQQSVEVDDLYAKLREAEGLLPIPPPSANVTVGTMNGSGSFTGLTTRYQIDPITKKPRPIQPSTTLNGLDAILVFHSGAGGSLTVTANGRTASSTTGTVSVNVGRARRVDWTLQAGGWTRSDTLHLSRPEVIGAGAFTLAALPISIVYEPPMNQARTNSASIGFRQEMTTVTTVSNGSSQSSAPKWATGVVMKSIFERLAKHWKPAAGAKAALETGKLLLGSVSSTTTSGTTVNQDATLGVSQVSAQTITTQARLGPGRGDLIVFYKDARVLWGMEEGEVTLTLIDHGPLAMVTVDTLLNDLNAVRAGQTAPVTGLDAHTLEALIRLDPLAPSVGSRPKLHVLGGVWAGDAPVLPAARFTKETSLLLSGSAFQNSVSHTVTQSDRSSTTSTSTTVTNCNPGWLSVIGIGVEKAGTFTTGVSLGSSRTDTVSSTVSASFSLSAGAGESYAVDVHYDNIFGSFLTRTPPPPPMVFEMFLP